MSVEQKLTEIMSHTSDAFAAMNARVRSLEQEASRPAGVYQPANQMLLKTVLDSQDFQAFRARGFRGKVTIPVKDGLFAGETKTTITSSAVGSSTPGILVPERIPGIVAPGIRKIRVRDLLPRMQTRNNAVEFVKENVFTNAASPVAETISKGESALTFDIDFETVKTLAHWIPCAKQVLDDMGGLSEYLNFRLLTGLKDIEDYELVGGDGTGQHLSGLINEATAYDTTRNVSGDTDMDKLNHAISQIEDVNLVPNAIIMNPRDWRTIQLVKTEEGGANKGRYILGGPAGVAQPVLWGLPVATTPAVARGEFLVLDSTRTLVCDRMDATIDISTENQDFFIRNMIAIRAEERLTLLVTRADAVVHGSF